MICKKCGKTLPEDSLFCQYCGAHFEDLAEDAVIEIEAESPTEVSEQEPVAAVEPMAEPEPPITAAETKSESAATSNERFCQKCGKALPEDSLFCQYCGAHFIEMADNTAIDTEAEQLTEAHNQKHISDTDSPKEMVLPNVEAETKNISKTEPLVVDNSKSVLRVLVAALIIGMAIGLVLLFNQNQNLAVEVEEKSAEAAEFERLYTIERNDHEKYQDLYYSIFDEYHFYHNNAVIVAKGVTNYHSYGCPRIRGKSFWIYNTEAAIGRDYDPCPECQ